MLYFSTTEIPQLLPRLSLMLKVLIQAIKYQFFSQWSTEKAAPASSVYIHI